MTTYRVTTELKTPWWLKLLRFFRIKDKRTEFYITFDRTFYEAGDIVEPKTGIKLKIIKQISR